MEISSQAGNDVLIAYLVKMKNLLVLLLIFFTTIAYAQEDYLLKPDRVFDGLEMHEDWVVAVSGNQITYAGPKKRINANETIEMSGMTLMPGIIEGHSHILLHPYNEQLPGVLRESTDVLNSSSLRSHRRSQKFCPYRKRI